jgi:hypothetical protein
LSFGLFITAIHTDHRTFYCGVFFNVPETAIGAGAALHRHYSCLIFGRNYLCIGVLGYVTDLHGRSVVNTGISAGPRCWPAWLLLYLSLNSSYPQPVAQTAQRRRGIVLVGTVLRVGRLPSPLPA